MVVFEQIGLFGKNNCIRAKWLYSGEVIVFLKGGCIRTKCLYWAKVFFLEQSSCIWEKVIVFGETGQNLVKIGCIRARSLCLCKIGCIRAKWLYSGKVMVFGQ